MYQQEGKKKKTQKCLLTISHVYNKALSIY